ncbi:jg25030 [Pararge aegeria aegeria]|uniref:Jg25030 protein n=1 Tax=Pararge aegeria aegeria TaxID=348720 RepID=A0A8S4R3Z1_9NEOP|nr:jg25030 [Pararge aegeria aegeria]
MLRSLFLIGLQKKNTNQENEVKRLKKSQKKKKRKGTDRGLSKSDHSEASTVVPETVAQDPSTSNPATDSTVENESLWKKAQQTPEPCVSGSFAKLSRSVAKWSDAVSADCDAQRK